MIIQYTDKKIVIDMVEVAKAATQIVIDSIVMSLMIAIHTDVISSSRDYYQKNCNSFTDNCSCFLQYSAIQSNNILTGTVDKVGGVFALATLAYISRHAISIGRRKFSQYQQEKKTQKT